MSSSPYGPILLIKYQKAEKNLKYVTVQWRNKIRPWPITSASVRLIFKSIGPNVWQLSMTHFFSLALLDIMLSSIIIISQGTLFHYIPAISRIVRMSIV